MNANINPTHRFNGVNQIDPDDPHFLKDVEVELVGEYGMCQSGYNGIVLVDAKTWCRKMHEHTPRYSVQEWEQFANEQRMFSEVRFNAIEQEVNVQDELVSINPWADVEANA